MIVGTAADRARLASYADIAAEYYDSCLHPTCASLRELSEAFLVPRIASLRGNERTLVEVGAGKSILAPAWAALKRPVSHVTLVDSAREMLNYSEEWRPRGATLICADATELPFENGSVDVLISSLGDPYNLPTFWNEVARVLRNDGIAWFTAPAFEWATRFRAPGQTNFAEFVRRDSMVLEMPSPAVTELHQAEMFAVSGLTPTEVRVFSAGDLSTVPAPKLMCLPYGQPLLRGYALRR